MRPSLRSKNVLVSCLAFHGSPHHFARFDPDLSRYDGDLLCLSVSPEVAADYGVHVYCCQISEARLISITVLEWLMMTEAVFSQINKNDADGFLIRPRRKSHDLKIDATFSDYMIALSDVSKCTIVQHTQSPRPASRR